MERKNRWNLGPYDMMIARECAGKIFRSSKRYAAGKRDAVVCGILMETILYTDELMTERRKGVS